MRVIPAAVVVSTLSFICVHALLRVWPAIQPLSQRSNPRSINRTQETSAFFMQSS